MKAESALKRIPDFSDAAVRAQLSDGPTNASYLVERCGDKFVLRLDKPESGWLGLDRENEKRVCETVVAAGLGPAFTYFDPRQGIYLRRWLSGRSWTETDLQNFRNLERLAGLLRKLHRLPAVGKPFDPLGAARNYAAAVGTDEAADLLDRAAEMMNDRRAGAAALCHNDLVCGNIFECEDGRLLLIDWEYAGVGDPYFDLAVVVQHHRLDQALSRYFLDAYLGRSASDEQRARLSRQCRFYQCLLELWELRIQLPSAGAH